MLEILTSILNGFSREFRLALSHVHSSMMSDAVADTKRGAFLLAMFARSRINQTITLSRELIDTILVTFVFIARTEAMAVL